MAFPLQSLHCIRDRILHILARTLQPLGEKDVAFCATGFSPSHCMRCVLRMVYGVWCGRVRMELGPGYSQDAPRILQDTPGYSTSDLPDRCLVCKIRPLSLGVFEILSETWLRYAQWRNSSLFLLG